jgi:ABC-type polysaccharide/polyol phosphate export permease
MARGWHFALRSVDPLNMIVGGFRDILFWHRLSRPGHLALMCGVCVVFFVACMGIFRRFAPELPKDV